MTDFVIAAVTPRRRRLKSEAAATLLQDYIGRTTHYARVELLTFGSEGDLLERWARERARARLYTVLLDSRGQALSSPEIAARLAELRDRGYQRVWFALGPAHGWSAAMKGQGDALLSLGPITLPHELCLVVLAEQLYRAHSILAGHPYHCGH